MSVGFCGVCGVLWVLVTPLSKKQLPDICLCQSKIYHLFWFPCYFWLEIKTRILIQLKWQLLLHTFNKRLLLMLTPKSSFVITGLSTQSASQSAPTSSFLTGSVGGPEKNWVQNMGCKKQDAKNRVIINQKEKRFSCLFSFWITTTLVFAGVYLLIG